jgi:hypothetical protein
MSFEQVSHKWKLLLFSALFSLLVFNLFLCLSPQSFFVSRKFNAVAALEQQKEQQQQSNLVSFSQTGLRCRFQSSLRRCSNQLQNAKEAVYYYKGRSEHCPATRIQIDFVLHVLIDSVAAVERLKVMPSDDRRSDQ